MAFIGSSANYNRCFYADLSRDPCGWGTSVPIINISQSSSTGTATTVGSASSIPSGSVGVLGGWEPPSGKIGVIVLPGLIAIVSLFMINTVESADLREDSRLSQSGKLFLKVDLFDSNCIVCDSVPPVRSSWRACSQSWLFVGFVLAFSAIASAIAIFVVIFALNPLAHYEPGIAAIFQVFPTLPRTSLQTHRLTTTSKATDLFLAPTSLARPPSFLALPLLLPVPCSLYHYPSGPP